MAKYAVAAWHQMYLDTCDTEHWYTCIEYIRRSITLAQKIGDKQSSQTYLDELFSKLVEINGNGNPYFSICATKFLVEQKYNNLEPILTVMDNILEKQTNIMTVKNLYKIKKGILLILKDDNRLRKNYIEHAQFLESQSNISPENKIQDLMKADSLLKEAVVLYRNAGESQSAEQAHNRLLAIQSELSNEMPITTDTFDVTNFYNHVKINFENLTFEEHIFMLSYRCPFFSKAEMKESISSPGRFFSRRYFEKQKLDSQGRTVCIIPSLDENSTEKDWEENEYFELFKKAKLYGLTTLRWGVELLNERFEYSEKELEFIVRNNNLIPENRKRIFLTAINYGLKGDLYVAVHILAPQMEALFRYYAQLLGSNISTLDGNGIAEDKLLSSVFDDECLNDGYDEDIIFTFRGLMNEKAGSNIRNKIAHGILTENECYGGDVLFFLCAVIKELLLTSPEAYKIHRKLFQNQNKTDETSATNDPGR